MSFYMIILYFLSGVISGTFGGMGMGGGTLLIPILTIFFSMEQKLSQGINLISFLVMSLIALIIHYKNGYLSLKGILYIIISGMIFAGVGSILAGTVPSKILRKGFGVFLCLLSIYQAYQGIFNKKVSKKHKIKDKKGKRK